MVEWYEKDPILKASEKPTETHSWDSDPIVPQEPVRPSEGMSEPFTGGLGGRFRGVGATGTWEEPTGFLKGFLQRFPEKLPAIGTGLKATIEAEVINATKRLKADKYDEMYSLPREEWTMQMKINPAPVHLRNEDIKLVEDYTKRLNEQYTTLGRAGAIMSEVPAFIADFYMTGGLASFGDDVARQVGTKILKKYVATKTGKAAIGIGAFGTSAALRATGMPHRAVESILSRQTPQNIEVNEDGTVDITEPPEGIPTSIVKGLADHYIEIASEQTGEFFAPAMNKLFPKLPFFGKLLQRLEGRWVSKTGKTVADFYKKAQSVTGFHGILAEIGEEYVGDSTRAILNVDDFGAGPDATMEQRLGAAITKDTDMLPSMALAFALPTGVMKMATRKEFKAMQRNEKFKETLQEAEINESRNIAQKELDQLWEGDTYAEEEKAYDFKEPGVTIKLGLTPKWLTNRIIGAESLLQDVTAAKTALMVEQHQLNAWIQKIEKKIKGLKSLKKIPERLPTQQLEEKINKEKAIAQNELDKVFYGDEIETETPEELTETLKKKITKNKPLYIMRDLLDTYENAPQFLTEEEANVFNQIRELTRYLRQRANIVREKMGLEPIGEVKAYITHWMDKTAEQIVNKDLPVHSGYLYHLMQGLPKTIKNKTAEKRKIRDDMESYFSKDLGRLLRIMTAYDLRDIHILHPYQAAWDELQRLRKDQLIPDSVFNEVEKFLRYDIRNEKARMDRAVNTTLKKPVDFLNKFLPQSKKIVDPSKQLFSPLRRLGILNGLGLRLKAPIRNLGQRLLLLDLYRGMDYAKAQAVAFRLRDMPVVKRPITGQDIPLLDLVREQDWYKASLTKFEDTYGAINRLETVPLAVYQKSHIGNLFLSNVEVSVLTGYFDWENNLRQSQDKNSEHYKNCVLQAKKLNVPVEQLLTHDADMMWNIREAVRRSQWEYMSISMPGFYRSQFNRAMGQFQSWWMNYFFNHSRECLNQMLTGRNSLGRLLTPHARFRAFKGFGTIQTIGRVVESILGIEMLKYLFAPLPGYLPPIPALIVGLIQYFGADDERDKKKALASLKYSLKFWIPFSTFWRDLNKTLSGDMDITEFIFYKKAKEKK